MIIQPFTITQNEDKTFKVEIEATDSNELVQFKGSMVSKATTEFEAQAEAQIFMENLILSGVHAVLSDATISWTPSADFVTELAAKKLAENKNTEVK